VSGRNDLLTWTLPAAATNLAGQTRKCCRNGLTRFYEKYGEDSIGEYLADDAKGTMNWRPVLSAVWGEYLDV
jgi:hypothetical protein